jgi:hypothetical protein
MYAIVRFDELMQAFCVFTLQSVSNASEDDTRDEVPKAKKTKQVSGKPATQT